MATPKKVVRASGLPCRDCLNRSTSTSSASVCFAVNCGMVVMVTLPRQGVGVLSHAGGLRDCPRDVESLHYPAVAAVLVRMEQGCRFVSSWTPAHDAIWAAFGLLRPMWLPDQT